MAKRMLLFKALLGSAALAAWLMLFAAGLLIETGVYRRSLAPEAYAEQLQTAEDAGRPLAVYKGSAVYAFSATTVCHTPTNLVFLTLLAGLLGGCSSNVVADAAKQAGSSSFPSRRWRYLQENPWSAMMRSFLVYLCIIAGLYFVVDDPFKAPTSSQYLRLAGTMSVLAFVVGYDPSRIEQWIRLVPNPQSTQVVQVRDAESGVELTAAQGPMATQAVNLDGIDDHDSSVRQPTTFHDASPKDRARGNSRPEKSKSIR